MNEASKFRPDFLLIPYQLIVDQEIEPMDEKVYAIVYWFEHLKDGECTASNETIAKMIKPSNPQIRTVQNSLNKLEERGYIERDYIDKERRNRLRIRTKASFKASMPVVAKKKKVDDSNEPVDMNEIIKKYENDEKRREFNIMALYFEERKPDIKNRGQLRTAVKRHLRPAIALKPFDDNQIIRGFEKAKRQTPEWTLETVAKMLTK